MPDETHCDEFHESGPNGLSPRVAYWPKNMAQTDPVAHAKGIMIRDHHYKYISRTLGSDEFYDLSIDPEEKMNRIEDAAYLPQIYKMKDAMLKWLEGTADVVPYQLDSRFTPEMIFARAKSHASPEDYDLIKEKIASGASFVEVMQFARESGQKHRS